MTEKQNEIMKQNEKKSRDAFLDWEHNESLKIVDKIKSISNYYKDIGHMDLVNYIQLENGTVATSKLCNMFLSCLAEDSRFSVLPCMIDKFQRIPYSRLSNWVNDVSNAEDSIYVLDKEDFTNKGYVEILNIYNNNTTNSIKSFVSGIVKDPKGNIIGICSFFYAEENLSDKSKEQCIELLKKYIISVEAVFIDYHINRKEMKTKLNII